MRTKNKQSMYFVAKLILVLSLFIAPLMAARADAASAPGCYKIVSAAPEKLTCPTKNAIYDNGKGTNISKPDPKKCYIYSANLYDGDLSFGEPYVEVPCTSLSACPSGQELRYSDTKLGAPRCVKVSNSTNGSFAGGATPSSSGDELPVASTGDIDGKYTCGKGDDNEVRVSFDFGCIGTEYSGPTLNPIIDIGFAIFRFLSAGVGIIVIGSIIVAGIQYSASRGNPQATEASIKRVANSVIALLLYMFIFAIANFLVPGGMFIK